LHPYHNLKILVKKDNWCVYQIDTTYPAISIETEYKIGHMPCCLIDIGSELKIISRHNQKRRTFYTCDRCGYRCREKTRIFVQNALELITTAFK